MVAAGRAINASLDLFQPVSNLTAVRPRCRPGWPGTGPPTPVSQFDRSLQTTSRSAGGSVSNRSCLRVVDAWCLGRLRCPSVEHSSVVLVRTHDTGRIPRAEAWGGRLRATRPTRKLLINGLDRLAHKGARPLQPLKRRPKAHTKKSEVHNVRGFPVNRARRGYRRTTMTMTTTRTAIWVD